MTKTADSIVTDFAVTLEYYKSEVDLTAEMADLINVVEPMVDTMKRVRLYQIMQARMRELDREDRP